MRKIIVFNHGHSLGGRCHIHSDDIATDVHIVDECDVAKTIVEWYIANIHDGDDPLDSDYNKALETVNDCTWLNDGWFYTIHDLN
jgi:hypothetical protein